MKKPFSVLFALALLAVAGTGQAQTVMFKSTTPSGVVDIACLGTDAAGYGAYTATGNSKAYSIRAASVITVHVYSDAGSLGTVHIDVGETTSGPWFPVTTALTVITDPSTVGETWNVPWSPYVRIRVATWALGTIRACLSAQRNEQKIY